MLSSMPMPMLDAEWGSPVDGLFRLCTLPLLSLGRNLQEASEMAALLKELNPGGGGRARCAEERTWGVEGCAEERTWGVEGAVC